MNTLHERHQTEVQIINNLHFITIKDLASLVKVSEMTVRRDCAFLADRGLIKQVYGGVTSQIPGKVSNYVVTSELKKHTNIKERIARKAISLLKPNDVFFLDSGTTAATIARLLPQDASYTIITSSFLALESLTRLDNSSIICPGGIYFNKPRVFFEQETADVVRRYRAAKSFIGATGFHLDRGITCAYFEDVPLKKAMLDSSEEKILITDSSKLDSVSTCVFSDIERFSTIIIDDGIPDKYVDFILSYGIELHIV